MTLLGLDWAKAKNEWRRGEREREENLLHSIVYSISILYTLHIHFNFPARPKERVPIPNLLFEK